MRALAVLFGVMLAGAATTTPVRLVQWTDIPPAIQQRLSAGGLSESAFPAFVFRQRRDTDRRMRDGNFDHIVYFALQSSHLSSLPPIEPALSARTFVERLQRARIPDDAAARLDAMAAALARDGARDAARDDARLALFREAIANAGVSGSAGVSGDARALSALLRKEYVRAMEFLYEKEFVAARAADGRTTTAALYQSRSHSTDTQIEAGYAVSIAIATLKAMDSTRRITRVLIAGPGLDLAPRTGLLEGAAPQSYQPFAIADALIAAGLSEGPPRIDLADINPLVVHHFTQLAASNRRVRLDIMSGLADDARTHLSDDYRDYVRQWGNAIAVMRPAGASVGTQAAASATASASAPATATSHLARTVFIDPAIARAMTATRFNVITDRFTDARQYDLIVITNALPYFNDEELMLALANIASLLAPGGAFIHNEPRPALLAATAAIGMPAVQSRDVLLASPAGGQPLHDTAVLNIKGG